jgi:hypothetical protein
MVVLDLRNFCGVCSGDPTNKPRAPPGSCIGPLVAARAFHTLPRCLLPPAAAAALIGAYSLAVFQSFAGAYSTKLSGGLFCGLLGILLSPGRGFPSILRSRPAVFAPRAREARRQHRPVVMAASVFSLLNIAFVAVWPIWWGGYCWGLRLLTEICAPMIVLVAVGFPAIRCGGV